MPKKILLADDEEDIRTVIKFCLTKAGYQVIYAMNGQEAVALAGQEEPDLILMDYKMPLLDGAEACRQIKGNPRLKDIPIIFMTASSMTISENLEADKVVSKPFEIGFFLQEVRNMLK